MISADGLIVTNHHVIEDATGLVVALNGRQFDAEVVGKDPATDLALLKIDPDGAELTTLHVKPGQARQSAGFARVYGGGAGSSPPESMGLDRNRPAQ